VIPLEPRLGAWWARLTLRSRLALWYAAGGTALVSLFAATLYTFVAVRLARPLDHQLRQDLAQVERELKVTTGPGLRWRGAELAAGQSDASEHPWFELWDDRGNLVVRRWPFTENRNLQLPPPNRLAAPGTISVFFVAPDLRLRTLTVPFAPPGATGPWLLRLIRVHQPHADALPDLQLIIFVALPIVVTLLVAGGYFFTRRWLLPLDRMAAEHFRDAAARGDLKRPGPLRAQIRRMLADPRAASLGERFFTQWLGIDGLAARQFDPAVYPGLDARMLTLMEQETTALCDRVVRGELPPRALLESTESFAPEELRAYYAQAAPAPSRPRGIFGHGSVLAATSNPTRTSPVKRGKWVLEALLDQAPPPPPPGVPQLPEGATNTEHRSIRELMAQHRANPDCASCHVRMDAIGLAFEGFDANGRTRTMVDGHAVEDTTELPGGATIIGVPGVATMVGAGTAFERSLARRLLVYALGRGTADADDPLVAALAARLARDRSFESLVMGIAMSDAFQWRRAPDAAGD
jgi:hypothetical protein